MQERACDTHAYGDSVALVDTDQHRDAVGDNELELLLPGLDDEKLVAQTTALLDRAGFDWCAFSTKRTTRALRKAMSSCHDITRAVLLEDAFLALAYRRTDLRPQLVECLTEALCSQAPFDHNLLVTALRTADPH